MRRALARSVLDRFALHGYALVTPPVFEFAEVLERGLGTLDPTDVLRFVEPESGEVAALRPDMTPQIARMIATRLRGRPPPFRLGYEGTVLRRRSGRARKHRQIPQAGVELAGVAGPEGDLELIALAVDALRATGLERFAIDLGDAGVVRALLADLPAERPPPVRGDLPQGRRGDRAGLRGRGRRPGRRRSGRCLAARRPRRARRRRGTAREDPRRRSGRSGSSRSSTRRRRAASASTSPPTSARSAASRTTRARSIHAYAAGTGDADRLGRSLRRAPRPLRLGPAGGRLRDRPRPGCRGAARCRRRGPSGRAGRGRRGRPTTRVSPSCARAESPPSPNAMRRAPSPGRAPGDSRMCSTRPVGWTPPAALASRRLLDMAEERGEK